MPLKQFTITSSAGKRLIAKAIVHHPAIRAAISKGTLVIVAGTTNGYVAEEVLASLGQQEGFSRLGFRRGAVLPPGGNAGDLKAEPTRDVIVVDGKWLKGKTIFDVAANLGLGDVILKGANAVHLPTRRAAVYIGHPQCGTAGAALPAVVGRRATMIVPVGLEKRVSDDVADLARLLNAPDAQGPRLLPLPGEAFTELDAIDLLSGAKAHLVAGGGIYGAEGCVWIAVSGNSEQLDAADMILQAILHEPSCQV
jgi:hypothetical protein